MKIKYLLFVLLFIQSIILAQTPMADQSNISYNETLRVGRPFISVAQSFKNGVNGTLSAISVHATVVTAGNFELKIYSGNSDSFSSLLITQPFTVTAGFSGDLIINFPAIEVTVGSTNTFKIRLLTSEFLPPNLASINLRSNKTTNAYPFGMCRYKDTWDSSRDLVFTTFVTPILPATHLNFDGVNDAIALPSSVSNAISGGSEITIEYWFKGTNVQSAVRFQGFQSSNFIVAGWNLSQGSTKFLVSSDGGTNGVNSASPATIQDNAWHHLAMVWKKNTIFATYLDGVLQNSRQAANVNLPLLTGNGGFIGAYMGIDEFTNGNLDDIRIWSVARSAQQIRDSKNCELQGTETGLVAYYKFNQGRNAVSNLGITTLIDSKNSANNGTLTNFALINGSSNWLSGSPTTGSIIPGLPGVISPVTVAQGASAVALTATTGVNGVGLLWYTAASGGAGSTVTPLPNTAIIGNTSYWVSSVNSMGCESERREIMVQITLPATHLKFDGVDDFVDLGSNSKLKPTSSITVEMRAFNSNWSAITNSATLIGNTQSGGWAIGVAGSNLTAVLRRNGSYATITKPLSEISAGWHHFAFTYNNQTLSFYMDGVLVNTNNAGASYNISYNASNSTIIGGESSGTAGIAEAGRYFNGAIDEVKIWNFARTALQIVESGNCEIQESESGLVAFYKFNQGGNQTNNILVKNLKDATSNEINGTLKNFALSGLDSNWQSGSPIISGSISPSAPIVSTIVIYSQGATAVPLIATIVGSGNSLRWHTTAIGGNGVGTAPIPNTTTLGNTSYWVSAINANGCQSKRVEIVVQVIISQATYLNFDGVNDRIELPNESTFDFTTTFSMEAWIRVTSFTQDWQTIISKGAEGPRIHRYSNTNFIAFGTGPFNDIFSNVSVNDGNWHHIAATCNNGLKSLYVDGILQATETVGLLPLNNDNVRIGSQINFYNPIRAFHGDIDEVRIWNTSRTPSQLNSSRNCELQGNETGLVAYYKFNQGINAADNTAINTLIDSKGTNTGILRNFSLNGTTSNWMSNLSSSVVSSNLPTFNQVAAICPGGTLAPLPTTSTNNITGTWSPALNNNLTTQYTFTAAAGQCASNATMTIAVEQVKTWKGSPASWTPCAPTSADDAVIATNYSEPANLVVRSLTVNNNAIASIRSGFDLVLTNILTVDPGSSLTLENNANLLQNTTATNVGNVTVNRNTLMHRLAFTNWSSPVTGQKVFAFSPLTFPTLFMTYNQITGGYNQVVNPNLSTFVPAVGYFVRAPNSFADAPSPQTSFIGSFTGVPNNGNYSYQAIRSNKNIGLNLTGNPYPSTILASAFFNANQKVEVLYFLNNSNVTASIFSNYAARTRLTGIRAAANRNSSKTPTDFIAVGQGFFAQIKAAGTMLNFTNTMRSSDNSNAVFFRTANTQKHLFKLSLLSQTETYNQIAIGYSNESTNGFDNQIDAKSFGESSTMISSLINDDEFAIQGRSMPFIDSDNVKLGFKTDTAGNYSIIAEDFEGVFDEDQDILLKDNFNGITQNIKENAYVFSTNSGTFKNRFEIVYYNSVLGINDPTLNSDSIFVYKKEQTINVNSSTAKIKNVMIYDLRGRLVVEQTNINANESKIDLNVDQQVLLIKITTIDNQIITKKIVY